jgi:hypothetical protein
VLGVFPRRSADQGQCLEHHRPEGIVAVEKPDEKVVNEVDREQKEWADAPDRPEDADDVRFFRAALVWAKKWKDMGEQGPEKLRRLIDRQSRYDLLE